MAKLKTKENILKPEEKIKKIKETNVKVQTQTYLTNRNNIDVDIKVETYEKPKLDNFDIHNAKISILRSEYPGVDISQYEVIKENIPIDVGEYIDDLTGYDDYIRQWYYKLKIESDGEVIYVPLNEIPLYANRNIQDKFIREILRRKNLVLKRKTGRKFFLLRRKSFGKHCSKCWDRNLFRNTDPNCSECYGTGWSGGFFKPLAFLGIANSGPKVTQLTQFGEWKPGDCMLYLTNFPLLVPKDVIVDDGNNRWSVVQIRTVEKKGIVIEQDAQITLISRDDIIYKYPINFSQDIEYMI